MNELEEFVSVFDDGLTALESELEGLRVSRRVGRQIFGAALLCRVISNLTGLQILHRHRLQAEAATLLRSCLESVFWLGAISRDAEFIDKIVKQDNQSKKTLAKNLLKQPLHLEQLDIVTIEALRSKLEDASPEGGLGRLEVFDAATAAGLASFYPIYLSISNQSAHPSAASLQKHVTFDKTSELAAIECRLSNEAEWVQNLEVHAGLEAAASCCPEPARTGTASVRAIGQKSSPTY
jgi:hypothetical protein